MMKDKFIFLEHTADIKFQAFGKNLNEVFENSALAMFKSMSDEKIKSKNKRIIKVKGNDIESLLYNFLEEFLFLLDTKNFFLSKVKVKTDGKKLIAEIFGDNVKNYKIHLDVKAVTYNEMFVKFNKKKKIWISQVVLDV